MKTAIGHSTAGGWIKDVIKAHHHERSRIRRLMHEQPVVLSSMSAATERPSPLKSPVSRMVPDAFVRPCHHPRFRRHGLCNGAARHPLYRRGDYLYGNRIYSGGHVMSSAA